VTVTVLRGRTSDRSPYGARGSELLGTALGAERGVRIVGEPGVPAVRGWEADLRDARPVLEAAAEAARGDSPVLVAAQCTIALATLPVIAEREPDALVVWLDAHGDFNTPGTTGSGYLGGMPLAAACGLWDGGHGAGLDPHRVVMSDARGLDTDERALLDRAGVRRVAPGAVADAVRGERVFLHLDLDILDPAVMAAAVPAPGGLALEKLAALLRDLGAAAEVVGVEITAFDDPAPERLAEGLAAAIGPVLPPLGAERAIG
jgi:arginase family enzyme